MTIHERMVARTEREKDLLKYGRSQERERIIKLLEDDGLNCDCDWCQISGDVPSQHHWRILRLIKEQQNG